MRIFFFILFLFILAGCGGGKGNTGGDGKVDGNGEGMVYESWLNDVNIFAFQLPPSRDVADTLGITVDVWEPVEDVSETKAQGRKAVPVPFVPAWPLESYAQWLKDTYGVDILDNYPCIDIQGNQVPVEDPQGLGEGMVFVCRALFIEKYRDLLERIIDDFLVPVKPDGVQIDEIHLFAPSVDWNMSDQTMEDFRSYLRDKYPEDELKNRFGIDDIDTFNYREYLSSNSMDSVFDDPNIDRRDEFRLFLYLSAREEVKGLIDYMRAKLGDVAVSGNTYSLWPEMLVFTGLLDFFAFENSFVTTVPRLVDWSGESFRFFGLYELGGVVSGGMGRIVPLPDLFDLKELSDRDDRSYYRLFVSEAFAMGENVLLPFDALTEGGGRYTIDEEILRPYTEFIREYLSLIRSGRRVKEIGVLYDWERSFRIGADGNYRYLFVTTALQEGQWQSGTILCGDGEIVESVPVIDDIIEYKAVVIPYGYSLEMSSCGEGVVQEYRNRGGSVIEVGENDTVDDILSMIDSLGLERIVDTGGERDVGVVLYRLGGDEMMMVLVNYDYDWNGKDFIEKRGIDINLRLPSDVVDVRNICTATPADSACLRRDFSLQGGILSFEFPDLEVLGIVRLNYGDG
ncbi:MAG TPA: hypothetical protein ENJ04_10195 [Nitrospirae bacterium]|nr:hypothetical protein [Nitrospirota bacterium]